MTAKIRHEDVAGLPEGASIARNRYVYFSYSYRENGRVKTEKDYLGVVEDMVFVPNDYYLRVHPSKHNRPLENWKTEELRQKAAERMKKAALKAAAAAAEEGKMPEPANIFRAPEDLRLLNRQNKMEGMVLLRKIKSGMLKAVFFDPQYRGVLDKLSYGNEGVSRGRARSALPQMSAEVISGFLIEIERVLQESGYLFLWVDKFHLVEGVAPWFAGLPSLQPVDLITWDKVKFGMGYRTRRRAEYMVILQKQPLKAKATWKVHDIPDVISEKIVREHPHSKPLQLQQRLIAAVTEEGDIVADPAAGGFSVMNACLGIRRNFIGCDVVCGSDQDGQEVPDMEQKQELDQESGEAE